MGDLTFNTVTSRTYAATGLRAYDARITTNRQDPDSASTGTGTVQWGFKIGPTLAALRSQESSANVQLSNDSNSRVPVEPQQFSNDFDYESDSYSIAVDNRTGTQYSFSHDLSAALHYPNSIGQVPAQPSLDPGLLNHYSPSHSPANAMNKVRFASAAFASCLMNVIHEQHIVGYIFSPIKRGILPLWVIFCSYNQQLNHNHIGLYFRRSSEKW